jgi:hypothetical protein
MIARIATAVLLASAWAPRLVAQRKPETTAAFERYLTQAEAQIKTQEQSAGTFLYSPEGAVTPGSELEARLRRGEMVIDQRGSKPVEVPGGLIHHWIGIAFVPGATIEQVLAVLKDYGELQRYYSPQIVSSRLISHEGDDYHPALRIREHKAITVVFDTEYDTLYSRLDANHQYAWSHSLKVSEIADPGKPSERALAPGEDHGFLWRLNTYWRFEQADGGTFVECEAISLTRDVPTGLGWLIEPFIRNLPKESLEFTLTATKDGVMKGEK